MKGIDGIATAFGTFIIVAIILYITYIATKYIAKNAGFRSESNNMKVIDSLSIGRSTMIMIVKVGVRYYLIGTGEQSVSMLGEIDPDEVGNLVLSDQSTERTVAGPFKEMFEKAKNRNKDNGKEK